MKTYYIYKKTFKINFPYLSFIDENNISITDYTALYVKIEIKDERLIERVIKINKIKKEYNILGDFLLYLRKYNRTILEVIDHTNQIDRNEMKYNMINSGSHPSNNFGDYNGRNTFYDF